jgi:hypothetical protein
MRDAADLRRRPTGQLKRSGVAITRGIIATLLHSLLPSVYHALRLSISKLRGTSFTTRFSVFVFSSIVALSKLSDIFLMARHVAS